MQVNSTTNVNTGATGATDSVPAANQQTLSQSDFLKLLVAQMTSQDPLNPTTSQDLLTQTVQLSTLQSNTSMTAALAQLQASQTLGQASSLLGRQVLVQADATTTAQGVVSGIDLSSGKPQIVVNGAPYDLSQVLGITDAPATSTANPTTNP